MQVADSTKTQNELNILILSDIHKALEMFEKLKSWIEREKERIDTIFILGFYFQNKDFQQLGDFDDLFQELKVDSAVCQKSEEMIKSMFQKLSFLDSEIFFIPGNHDPLTLFQKTAEKQQLAAKAINLHKCEHYIKKDLRIIGLGGSVPATKNCTEHWVGYPYLTDNQYAKDVSELNQFFSEDKPVQTILLTHVGPSSSQTANDSEEDAVIYAGSQALDKFLFGKAKDGQVFCNLHGHTHNGRGMNTIQGIQIMNPGPFKTGNFAIMKLVRQQVLDLWQIWKLEFINLLNSNI